MTDIFATIALSIDSMLTLTIYNYTAKATHALSIQSPKLPPSTNKTIGHQRFQNQGKNTVSSIIGSYKSAISKHANRLGLIIDWQSRFYEHIIRDDAEYSRIAEYIEANISNWITDKFFNKEDLLSLKS